MITPTIRALKPLALTSTSAAPMPYTQQGPPSEVPSPVSRPINRSSTEGKPQPATPAPQPNMMCLESWVSHVQQHMLCHRQLKQTSDMSSSPFLHMLFANRATHRLDHFADCLPGWGFPRSSQPSSGHLQMSHLTCSAHTSTEPCPKQLKEHARSSILREAKRATCMTSLKAQVTSKVDKQQSLTIYLCLPLR